jgi:hypothetical protein
MPDPEKAAIPGKTVITWAYNNIQKYFRKV